MTDNEKAATFIGWERHECLANVVCAGHKTTGPHYSPPAPDMSDPRNYMKALEELEKRGLDYQINFNRSVGNADVNRAHYIQIGLNYWYDGGIKTFMADSEGATLATTIIKALVNLYDAEHSK